MSHIPVIGKMINQVQHQLPAVSDATIMDDTVVTMDSSTALMGGQTTIMPMLKQRVEVIKPRAIIKLRR